MSAAPREPALWARIVRTYVSLGYCMAVPVYPVRARGRARSPARIVHSARSGYLDGRRARSQLGNRGSGKKSLLAHQSPVIAAERGLPPSLPLCLSLSLSAASRQIDRVLLTRNAA